MPTYALIHGAGLGAWCWTGVIDALARRGHPAIAVDLPADNPDRGLLDYRDTVIDALASVAGDVVLVGHSLGGLTLPLVAAERPVQQMVFVCAYRERLGSAPLELPGGHCPMLSRPDRLAHAIEAQQ